MTSPRVVAVVVTWNRRDLLSESLDALHNQTRPLDAVVVIDNASTDGTAALLAGRPEVDAVTLSFNSGGAGGFAAGTDRALGRHRPDLIWLMDDDTVATPTALEALLRVRESSARSPALLASKVIWTDGRDHPMNTPRRKPGASRAESDAADSIGAVPIRSASFVSVLCDAAVIGERGLPIADYFLWNDDFEYTTRLLRHNIGLYCPASVVVHKTKTFGSTDADPGPRFYYEVRNKIWMFTRSASLAPWEKLAYGGSTLIRWGRTVTRSRRRRIVLGALVRGLRDGLRAGPRPNAVVLDERS